MSVILNDICELIVDCEHKTAPIQDTGYPSIRTPNIGPGYFILDGVNRVSEETYRNWTRRAVPQQDDIIMAREAPVGNAAIIPSGLNPCLGQRTLLIRPHTSKVYPRYLNFLINGPQVQSVIHAKTNGATVPHLNMKDVRNLPLPELPSLAEQKRIADILSAYDELIQNNQRRIKILEEMARSLYREWFVHFRYPGHEKDRRVKSAMRGTSASLGAGIPEGWEVRKLSRLVTTQYGYTESSTDSPIGPKYLRGMDINKASYIDWSQVPYCPISDEDKEFYSIKKGDVFIIRMADPGKVGIAEVDIDAVFASYLIRVRPINEQLRPYFLFYLLESPAYQNYISGASTGTTRKSASAVVITDFQFVLPTKKIIEEYETQTATIREMLTTLVLQIQNLRQMRDLLLPRLISPYSTLFNHLKGV